MFESLEYLTESLEFKIHYYGDSEDVKINKLTPKPMDVYLSCQSSLLN